MLLAVQAVLGAALPVEDQPPLQSKAGGHGYSAALPAEDSFYTPPPGFESAALGTILKTRNISNTITLNNKDPIKLKGAWQILYRTQNSVRDPAADIVTVLAPFNNKPDHLLSYAMFSVCCCPLAAHSFHVLTKPIGLCVQRVNEYCREFYEYV